MQLLQRIRFSVAALGYKGQWYGKSDKPKLEMKSPIVRVQAFPASTAVSDQHICQCPVVLPFSFEMLRTCLLCACSFA